MSQANAEQVERSLRYYQEQQGGLALTAYYESVGILSFTICEKWQIFGVTDTDTELSITGQMDNHPVMTFTIRNKKHLAKAKLWFEEAASRMMSKVALKEVRIPPEIIFIAEVTGRMPQVKAVAA